MFFYVMAYIIPAVVVWGVLAIVVHSLTHLPLIMLLVAWMYALVLGLLEALAISFRPLSLNWQVPAQWLQSRSAFAQTLIWGTALGPGFVTRNPYAGIWLLPVMLTLNQHIFTNLGIGIVIGIAHGGARAIGVLLTRQNLDTCGSGILKQWRWRVADGLMLLFGAGCFTATVLTILLTLSH
jgi:hypothetical protein